jgi:hypothetical protein
MTPLLPACSWHGRSHLSGVVRQMSGSDEPFVYVKGLIKHTGWIEACKAVEHPSVADRSNLC